MSQNKEQFEGAGQTSSASVFNTTLRGGARRQSQQQDGPGHGVSMRQNSVPCTREPVQEDASAGHHDPCRHSG